MQNKYMSLLGLARRAGKLSAGHDTALEALRKGTSALIVFSSDASDRLKREMTRQAEKSAPAVRCLTARETMDEIHYLLGCRAGVLSVNDGNFAVRIAELMEQEENAYGDKN